MPPLLAARRLLPLAGIAAFALAALSLVDMYLPRPYDGVVLESDAPGQLMVADVVAGSGAERAGIVRGDRIVGIGREVLRSEAHAADLLRRHRIGDSVPYLVETPRGRRELPVELGPRRIGSLAYLGAALLGFAFFAVGSFVLGRRPELLAARLFYLLSALFLVFLVCRLRPASYSAVDVFVLQTGTFALLLLPATFLHFFLVFPRPLWEGAGAPLPALAPRRRRRAFLVTAYALPLLVFVYNLLFCMWRGEWILISGAPRANWWLLGVYMVLGLAALAANAAPPHRRQRAARRLVRLPRHPLRPRPLPRLHGGLPLGAPHRALPLLRRRAAGAGAAHLRLRHRPLPAARHPRHPAQEPLLHRDDRGGHRPLRRRHRRLQLGLPGLGAWPARRGSRWRFALAIVLGLEPLRRRLQGPVDRFFYGELPRLQRAMVELGEALSADRDPGALVHELVEGLPRQLGLHFAALYLAEEGELRRAAGPASLPATLADPPELHRLLHGAGGLAPIELLAGLAEGDAAPLLQALADGGVEVAAELASPRRRLGAGAAVGAREPAVVGARRARAAARPAGAGGDRPRDRAAARRAHPPGRARARDGDRRRHPGEPAARLAPLRAGLAGGGALPPRPPRRRRLLLRARHHCREGNGSAAIRNAFVYGDVAGKSVPAALMMMAAHEVLHSLALTDRGPEELLALANRRLYQLRRRSFVALGYLVAAGDGAPGRLRYVLAGQPGLLLRRADGGVEELPLCRHRVPLGALAEGDYTLAEVAVAHGELVLGYSDGVLDARSPDGDFFGAERLAEALAGAPAEPAAAVESILARLAAFTRGEDPYDDVTLVALGRHQEVQDA